MTTNGIKFYYAPEATAGTQPTTGWVEIPNVVSWGEIGSTPDTIEITPSPRPHSSAMSRDCPTPAA